MALPVILSASEISQNLTSVRSIHPLCLRRKRTITEHNKAGGERDLKSKVMTESRFWGIAIMVDSELASVPFCLRLEPSLRKVNKKTSNISNELNCSNI